jgi:hypothetical protein
MAEQIDFVDPDGAVTSLYKTRGAAGLFMPPLEITSTPFPQYPGSYLLGVRYSARIVSVPVLLEGASRAAYIAVVRALGRTLDPDEGQGTLRVTRDGDVRELGCLYSSGLDSLTDDAPVSSKPTLSFNALDPFWYDGSDTSQTFTTAQAAATFFPFFPLRLSSSEVFADVTVDNTGDKDAWPVWQVTGPGSALVLRNLTTGEMLSSSADVPVGETVTIDTRMGVKTVVNGTTNLFPTLSADSSLWALAKGTNAVRIELTGATASSSVTLLYRRRWLSA